MTKSTHRVSHNVAPLYAEPATSSEQISQLIWGAGITIHETSGDFCRVTGEDLYSGWIRSAFLAPLVDDQDSAVTTVATLFGEVYSKPEPAAELITRLTTGARVVLSRKPMISGFMPIEMPGSRVGYIHETQTSLAYSSLAAGNRTLSIAEATRLGREELHRQIRQLQLDRVFHSSLLFIGVPYLWGGTTPFGLDCSGFTQLVYKISGIQLLRDASLQRRDNRFDDVDSFRGLSDSDFKRSDLLFFNSAVDQPGRITHVGLALGDGRFIHAVGKGRGTMISTCSDEEFSRTFVAARRLKEEGSLAVESAA